MNACRSCGAPILWARTEAGKSIPLDSEPHPGGTIRIDDANPPLAIVVTIYAATPDELFGGAPLYRSHFATCPDADRHRKGRT